MDEFWISPSKLETFRKYVDSEMWGFFTEEKVIEAVKGLSPYSPQANFGTAFHAVIEHGPERFSDPVTGQLIVKVDDMPSAVILHPLEIKDAVNYRYRYPNMKFENWIFHDIKFDNCKVVLIMRADGINGLEVHENKTSTHEFNEEDYFRSVQWKIYLEALHTNVVQYNHFFYKNIDPDSHYRMDNGPTYNVEYNYSRFYRPKNNASEIKDLCYSLIRFCADRGIKDFLKRKK